MPLRIPPRLRWTCQIVAVCCAFSPPATLLAQPTAKVVLGRWARHLEVGPEMDARGVKLYGSEFVDQDLRNARFDHCVLYGVKFEACRLNNASFRGAILAGAFLDGTNYCNADFTDAVISNMRSRPSFTPEQLMSTHSYKTGNLENVLISGRALEATNEPPQYDFRRANLSGARFSAGDFTKSDFAGAILSGVSFGGSLVSFESLSRSATFRSRQLQGMTFGLVRFVDACDFSGMDLTGARFSNLRKWGAETYELPIKLDRAIIRGARFSESPPGTYNFINKEHIYSTASYRQGDLRGVTFSGLDLSGIDFSKQNLTGAAFIQCDLSNADFTDAVITGASFGEFARLTPFARPNPGLTIEQIRSTWNFKQGRMDGIQLPPDLSAALAEEAENR